MPDNVNAPDAQNAEMAAITPDVVTEGTPDVTPVHGKDEFSETFLQSMMSGDLGDPDLAREIREGLGVTSQASEPAQPEQPHPQATRTQHTPEGTPPDMNWDVEVVDPNDSTLGDDFLTQPVPLAEPTPEPPPDVSPKAANRFQQLANERKAERERADALAAQVAELTKLMAQQTATQTQAAERAMRMADAQAAEAERRRQLEQWQSEGMNPADFGHQVTVQGLQKANEASIAVETLRAEIEQMRHAQAIQAYQADVQETVRRSLASYDVSAEQAATFAQQAVTLGVASDLRSREAVKQVLSAVVSFLPKKGAAPTPKPAKTGVPAPVASGIAARASGSGRPGVAGPGTPAPAGARRTVPYDGNLTIMQNMARMPGFEGLGDLDR